MVTDDLLKDAMVVIQKERLAERESDSFKAAKFPPEMSNAQQVHIAMSIQRIEKELKDMQEAAGYPTLSAQMDKAHRALAQAYEKYQRENPSVEPHNESLVHPVLQPFEFPCVTPTAALRIVFPKGGQYLAQHAGRATNQHALVERKMAEILNMAASDIEVNLSNDNGNLTVHVAISSDNPNSVVAKLDGSDANAQTWQPVLLQSITNWMMELSNLEPFIQGPTVQLPAWVNSKHPTCFHVAYMEDHGLDIGPATIFAQTGLLVGLKIMTTGGMKKGSPSNETVEHFVAADQDVRAKDALAWYTEDWCYSEMNRSLRTGAKDAMNNCGALVSEVRHAMSFSWMPQEVKLFADVVRRDVTVSDVNQMLASNGIGDIWTQPGFESYTALWETGVSPFHRKNMTFFLDLTKVKKAGKRKYVPVSIGSLSAFPKEAEVLLPAFTKIKLAKVLQSTGNKLGLVAAEQMFPGELANKQKLNADKYIIDLPNGKQAYCQGQIALWFELEDLPNVETQAGAAALLKSTVMMRCKELELLWRTIEFEMLGVEHLTPEQRKFFEDEIKEKKDEENGFKNWLAQVTDTVRQ